MRWSSLFFCIVFTKILWSQHYNFIPYSVIDGLAQSQVSDIAQDHLGNLWIGTQSGLSRFDSKTFVNFSVDDGLADNVISKILIADSGEIWAITSNGISRYDNGKFKSFYFEENERVNDVIELNDRIVLATNQSLIEFSDSKFSIIFRAKEQSLKIRALELMNDTVLLCGTNHGAFKYNDGQFDQFVLEGLPDLNLSDLVIRDHQLILATLSRGIIEYNLRSHLYTAHLVEGIPIRSLYVDAVSIWASSNFGVLEIRNGKTTYYTEENGLSINTVKTVFKDMESNIWIGTFGKGLLKFAGNAITSYSTLDGLSSDIVMSISQFKNGNFVFGTYDKGACVLSKDGRVELFDKTSGLNHNSVWATLVDSKDRCWLGTSKGLQCLERGTFSRQSITKQIDRKIRSIAEKDGVLYFGGTAGLWILKGSELTQVLTGKDYDINKILVANGKVIIATGQGLFYQNISEFEKPFRKINLAEGNVNTVSVDRYGTIWAGTINGLFLVSPDLTSKNFMLDRANYKSKNIMGVIKDRYHRMWVSTAYGLYIAVPNGPMGGATVLNQYTLSEGLLDMESNLNALYEDKDGKIWMGTSIALEKIAPVLNPVLFSYNLPKLSITGLRLFKESFKYSDYEIGDLVPSGVPKSITLNHTKNHLTFDFIGVNNKNPDKVYYTYRLLGAEDKWSPITKENSASYSFISPGVSEFQVKSANKNLEWTEPVVLKIIIRSPYWKRWWFILVVVLMCFGLAYFILNARISGIKQKKDNERLVSENKLRNLEQQSLNASMNRHFIFNSLNSIQYFINSSDKKSANKYLSNFAQLIRKNLDSSTQANFLVTLNEEIERIELYLTLEKMRFSEKFDYKISLVNDIDLEIVRVPSMILQPFVENSIIHGVLPKKEKGLITITIKEESDFVVFEVIDNGVGIDTSLSTKESFKGDHKSQGMEITANRIDLLRRINGDKLMIIGPFQINNSGKPVGTKVIIKLPVY